MQPSKIDTEKPVWALWGKRAWGPFRVHTVGVSHAIVHVPNDRRMWVDAGRCPPSKMGRALEEFPLICLTQDAAAAVQWNERNEPVVGDLVSYRVRKREWRAPKTVVTDTTVEGVVIRDTGHQVVVHTVGHDLPSHVAKDSCVVLSGVK